MGSGTRQFECDNNMVTKTGTTAEEKQKHKAKKPPKKAEGKKKAKSTAPPPKKIKFSLTVEYAIHLVRILFHAKFFFMTFNYLLKHHTS